MLAWKMLCFTKADRRYSGLGLGIQKIAHLLRVWFKKLYTYGKYWFFIKEAHHIFFIF